MVEAKEKSGDRDIPFNFKYEFEVNKAQKTINGKTEFISANPSVDLRNADDRVLKADIEGAVQLKMADYLKNKFGRFEINIHTTYGTILGLNLDVNYDAKVKELVKQVSEGEYKLLRGKGDDMIKD